MNILIVNTYHHKYGGAQIYALTLSELLSRKGHKVVPFAMKSSKNAPTEYEKYFVSGIDFPHELKHFSVAGIFRVLRRTFHFGEASKRIAQLLNEVPIDVVHLHNFLHHITLSIISPIRQRGIPIVWTLHDHILVCPNTNLFNDSRHKPCASCTSTVRRAILPILRKCKKKSLAASAVAAAEAIYIAAKGASKIPDFFIAPSEFLKEQHRRMGFDVTRFVVVPNFVDCNEFKLHNEPGDYALYMGRLSQEKGLEYLIRAFAKLKNKKLVIAGTGPDEQRLKKLAQNIDAPVEFVGYHRGAELKKLLYNARFTVLPSICYENAPLSILESFAAGKPVVASNIGGVPEMVKEDVGVLFPPADQNAIAKVIENLWDDEAKIVRMGNRAREIAQKKYSVETHIEKILHIYQKAVNNK